MIDDQIVDDILCAAMEGGINYWCKRADIAGDWPADTTFLSETLSKGADIIFILFRDDITDGVTEYKLTRDAFESAIAFYANERGMSINELYEDHDADDADNIMQKALFGEYIYG